tara:strand:+ start:583 stop:1068 length:486 start_codon:yes stop_codon:yes gene_type:complete
MQAEFKSDRTVFLESQIMAPCCYGGVLREHDSEIANNLKLLISYLIENPLKKNEIIKIINNTVPNLKNIDFKNDIFSNMSNSDIINFFIKLYGPRIKASPPINGLGIIAWNFPLIILIVGLITSTFYIKKFIINNPKNSPKKKFDENHEKKIISKLKDVKN